MKLTIEGRVAVVTGASRGVGRSIALALAANGAWVALGARRLEELQAVEREIVASGGRGVAIPLDVSDLSSAQAFIAQTQSLLGAPTILVNNAGIFGPFSRLVSGDPQHWASVIRINLLGAYFMARLALPSMLATGWGRIVNVSSTAGLVPPDVAESGYSTTKVALNHLTRCLAVELEGSGITANAIHPGEVVTDMTSDILRQASFGGPECAALGSWAEAVAQNGGDPPEKAADLVLRLLSEESASISGYFHTIEASIGPVFPAWSEPPPLPR